MASYYSNRAICYIKTEAYGAAIADATKALEIDPTCECPCSPSHLTIIFNLSLLLQSSRLDTGEVMPTFVWESSRMPSVISKLVQPPLPKTST